MRIGARLPSDGAPTDVATALERAAGALGMRPGVVVRSPEGRSEQGIASLANWASKIAHLLREDGGLSVGDPLGLDAPPGWTTASACLAAWWLGLVIVPAADAEVVVRHDRRPPTPHARLELIVGDAFDGTAVGSDPELALTWRAQVLPDRPPPPERDGRLRALEVDGGHVDQATLLAAARADGRDRIGLLTTRDASEAPSAAALGALLAAAVLRPLVTGATTVVVLDGGAVDDEGVTRWMRPDTLPPLG
jgi:acyl-CoA synthetase (AMP-forming)/AMP-acid ligase II